MEDDPGLPLLRGEPGGISSCSAAIGEAPGPAGSWLDGEVRVAIAAAAAAAAAADDVETASPFIGTGTIPAGEQGEVGGVSGGSRYGERTGQYEVGTGGREQWGLTRVHRSEGVG